MEITVFWDQCPKAFVGRDVALVLPQDVNKYNTIYVLDKWGVLQRCSGNPRCDFDNSKKGTITYKGYLTIIADEIEPATANEVIHICG